MKIRGFESKVQDTAPILDTPVRSAVTGKARRGPLTQAKVGLQAGQFFRNKGFTLIVSLFLLPSLGWGLTQLFSLNREVGELKSEIESLSYRLEALKNEGERSEDRVLEQIRSVSSDMERFEKRIDNLANH